MEMFKITYIILIIMNDKKYGICGIDCSKCPAYIATINDDNVLREKTAKEWSKLYGLNLKPEDINCLGCHNDKVLWRHCKECDIRKCALSKKLSSCAYCPYYPCNNLRKWFDEVPEAKENLNKSRNKKRK